jgi:hypothetical protein
MTNRSGCVWYPARRIRIGVAAGPATGTRWARCRINAHWINSRFPGDFGCAVP